MIQIVATDLDGTLLRPDLTVSDFTRAQLRRVVDTGRTLVFVTGRPPRWLAPVIQQTGHEGTAICANGAVLVDVAAEQIVAATVLSAVDLADVCGSVRDVMGPQVRFGVEVAPLGAISGSRLRHEPGFAPVVRTRLDEVRLPELTHSGDAVKLLARGTGDVAETESIVAAVRSAVGDAVIVSHSSRTDQLLEIAPAGVTKASALAELVARSGHTPDHVVAFGDMPNDIPMLSWAGRAVAVADAHAELAAVADEVIPAASADGVATWLRDNLA